MSTENYVSKENDMSTILDMSTEIMSTVLDMSTQSYVEGNGESTKMIC